jgi:hypothetical protein
MQTAGQLMAFGRIKAHYQHNASDEQMEDHDFHGRRVPVRTHNSGHAGLVPNPVAVTWYAIAVHERRKNENRHAASAASHQPDSGCRRPYTDINRRAIDPGDGG